MSGLNVVLGTYDFIPNGSDLNKYISGTYMVGDATKLKNSPSVSWGILIAFGSYLAYNVQIYISVLDSQNNIYVRTRRETGEWSCWFKK